MRVLALTKYGTQAASTRQRFVQYAPYLAANGVSLDLSPLIGNDQFGPISRGLKLPPHQALRSYARRLRALAAGRRYDLIWVHCELFPHLPGVMERLIRLTGTPYVFDFDDAIFHMYDAHPRPIVRTLLGTKLQPLLRSARAALCGNDYLRDYASRFCPNSVVVPTVVDTGIYRPRDRAPGPAEAPLIGWIGSPSTFADVEPFIPAILSVAQRRGARFRVIGGGPRASGIEGLEAVDWSEAAEVAEVRSMDVGIMPVADRPFQRGKCGYKLIQYLACEVPVVASPVGVNGRLAIPGETGFLAATGDEWAAALDRLLGDPALRTRMGRAGRALVEAQYSLASQQGVVHQTLVAAAGGSRSASAGPGPVSLGAPSGRSL